MSNKAGGSNFGAFGPYLGTRARTRSTMHTDTGPGPSAGTRSRTKASMETRAEESSPTSSSTKKIQASSQSCLKSSFEASSGTNQTAAIAGSKPVASKAAGKSAAASATASATASASGSVAASASALASASAAPASASAATGAAAPAAPAAEAPTSRQEIKANYRKSAQKPEKMNLIFYLTKQHTENVNDEILRLEIAYYLFDFYMKSLKKPRGGVPLSLADKYRNTLTYNSAKGYAHQINILEAAIQERELKEAGLIDPSIPASVLQEEYPDDSEDEEEVLNNLVIDARQQERLRKLNADMTAALEELHRANAMYGPSAGFFDE
ncbi:large ribosomal subunit protein eL22 [Helicoverpa armigera]